ncbi:hypothetical protein JHW43_007111 [Diplocarpon mali]|nr:hypothetical protein JHW43_007111 [Diplocarpon mali]
MLGTSGGPALQGRLSFSLVLLLLLALRGKLWREALGGECCEPSPSSRYENHAGAVGGSRRATDEIERTRETKDGRNLEGSQRIQFQPIWALRGGDRGNPPACAAAELGSLPKHCLQGEKLGLMRIVMRRDGCQHSIKIDGNRLGGGDDDVMPPQTSAMKNTKINQAGAKVVKDTNRARLDAGTAQQQRNANQSTSTRPLGPFEKDDQVSRNADAQMQHSGRPGRTMRYALAVCIALWPASRGERSASSTEKQQAGEVWKPSWSPASEPSPNRTAGQDTINLIMDRQSIVE